MRHKFVSKGNICSESVMDTTTNEGVIIPDADVEDPVETTADPYFLMGIGDKTNGITGGSIKLTQNGVFLNGDIVNIGSEKEIWLKDGATFTDLQNAVNTLNSGSGGTIHLPVGTITCTSAISLTQPIKIVGHGTEASVLVSNVAGALIGLNHNNCILQDFYISLDPSAGYPYGVYINANSCLVRNVRISGSVDTDSTESYCISMTTSAVYTRITDCILSNTKYGVNLVGSSNLIDNCNFIGTLIGIRFYGPYYCSVENCNFRSIGPSVDDMYILYFVDAHYNTISNITGYRNGGTVLYDYYLDLNSADNMLSNIKIVWKTASYDGGTNNKIDTLKNETFIVDQLTGSSNIAFSITFSNVARSSPVAHIDSTDATKIIIDRTGYYRVNFGLLMKDVDTSATRWSIIRVNGTDTLNAMRRNWTLNDGYDKHFGSGILHLNKNDEVQLVWYRVDASNTETVYTSSQVYNYFELTYLGL